MPQNTPDSPSDGPAGPKPPSGLKRSGRALWQAVAGPFELGAHELKILHEAARTADSLDALQTIVDNEGHMSTSTQGVRVHPALVELRQQRITFARLCAALAIPAEDDTFGTVSQSGVRSVRGVYGPRAVS